MNGTGTAEKAEQLHLQERERNRREADIGSDVTKCYELARNHFGKKRFSEALDAVDKLLARDPFHSEGLILNARIHETMGKLEESRAAYHRVLEDHPDRSLACREFGRYLLLREDSPGQAEVQLLSGLAINPRDAFAHVLLADVYCRTDRERQAILHLEIAVRFPLEDARFYDRFAKLLTRIHAQGTDTGHLGQALLANAGNRARSRFKRAMRAQRRENRNKPAFTQVIRRVWFKNRAVD